MCSYLLPVKKACFSYADSVLNTMLIFHKPIHLVLTSLLNICCLFLNVKRHIRQTTVRKYYLNCSPVSQIFTWIIKCLVKSTICYLSCKYIGKQSYFLGIKILSKSNLQNLLKIVHCIYDSQN